MTSQPKAPHEERTAGFLEHLQAWIEPREDVRALMVVGSVARGDARPDSDVDVVLLTNDPPRYLENLEWVSDFGAAHRVDLEYYGKVTSVRATYGDGLAVEFTIAAADWASTPFDPGTEAAQKRERFRGWRVWVVVSDVDAYPSSSTSRKASRSAPAPRRLIKGAGVYEIIEPLLSRRRGDRGGGMTINVGGLRLRQTGHERRR